MEMTELRLGAIEEVRRNLNRGFLTPHDFEITANGADGTLLRVAYKGSDFYFALLRPQTEANRTGVWKTVELPGRHFTSAETYDHQQFASAFGSVYGWLDRIVEEIVLEATTHKDTSQIDQMRRKLEEAADNLSDPGKPFTPEELNEWSNRFKAVLERLAELERNKEIQQGRVQDLARQLEELRKQGTTIPKRTWVKTAGNKVLDFISAASEGAVSAIAEGAVKAMLEHKP